MYITSGDAAFSGVCSFNNHLIPVISTPLLSSSNHRRTIPGLYRSGAACMTTVCVFHRVGDDSCPALLWVSAPVSFLPRRRTDLIPGLPPPRSCGLGVQVHLGFAL